LWSRQGGGIGTLNSVLELKESSAHLIRFCDVQTAEKAGRTREEEAGKEIEEIGTTGKEESEVDHYFFILNSFFIGTMSSTKRTCRGACT
jgi:hypothetical protein